VLRIACRFEVLVNSFATRSRDGQSRGASCRSNAKVGGDMIGSSVGYGTGFPDDVKPTCFKLLYDKETAWG